MKLKDQIMSRQSMITGKPHNMPGPVPPRMRVDVVLSLVAGTAQALAPHYPELYLQAIHDEAVAALSKWPLPAIHGRKGRAYLRRVKRVLDALAPVFRPGISMAAVLLVYAGMVERLWNNTGRRRNMLDPLRDLLNDYMRNLPLEQHADQAADMLRMIDNILGM